MPLISFVLIFNFNCWKSPLFNQFQNEEMKNKETLSDADINELLTKIDKVRNLMKDSSDSHS